MIESYTKSGGGKNTIQSNYIAYVLWLKEFTGDNNYLQVPFDKISDKAKCLLLVAFKSFAIQSNTHRSHLLFVSSAVDSVAKLLEYIASDYFHIVNYDGLVVSYNLFIIDGITADTHG